MRRGRVCVSYIVYLARAVGLDAQDARCLLLSLLCLYLAITCDINPASSRTMRRHFWLQLQSHIGHQNMQLEFGVW